MAKSPPTFRVRLNCVDHYQATPSQLDPPIWGAAGVSATQRQNLPQVPVIRVFGSTETGQKVCAHIHGALPYLFIPYTESLAKEKVSAYIETLRHSIDHALALSYRRNPYDNPRNSTFVAHISLVKGIPFFGYHVGYKYFLKVYLLNPLHMTRFSDLLQQGAIMKRVFQPYEAHLQYLLQWMCDYNLFGCAYIDVDVPYFRRPLPIREDLENPLHLWHDRSVLASSILDEDKYPRQSHCELEVDVCVENILNRLSIKPRDLHHSFIERLASLENLPPEEKLVHSMAGLWKDETQRRKRRMGLTDPSSSPFPPEVLISMSADPRNDSAGGWIHEEEFRQLVSELAKAERETRGDNNISFKTFRAEQDVEDGVTSVFDSVRNLFRDTLISSGHVSLDLAIEDTYLGEDRLDVQQEVKHEDIEIDMSTIAQIAAENYESDEDTARLRALTQQHDRKAENSELDFSENSEYDTDPAAPAPARIQASGNEAFHKLSRTPKRRAAQDPPLSPFKKNKSHIAAGDLDTKRVKFSLGKNGAERLQRQGNKDLSLIGDGFAEYFDSSPLKLSPQKTAVLNTSGQGTPVSSQRSSQSSQNRQLQFPVIKNAPGLDTALRLSQQSADEKSPRKVTTSIPLPYKSNSERSSSDWRASSAKGSSTSSSKTIHLPVSHDLVAKYGKDFSCRRNSTVLMYNVRSPSRELITDTLEPKIIYQDAYYSNEKDIPERVREYAGQEFKLTSKTMPHLPAFDKTGSNTETKMALQDKNKDRLEEERRRRRCTLRTWEIMSRPPSWSEVHKWMTIEHPEPSEELDTLEIDGPPASSQRAQSDRPKHGLSQIDGPTQKNKHGFKFSQKKATTSVQHETGYMSIMSLEVHVNSRDDLTPDPERDEIGVVAWCLHDERLEEERKFGLLALSSDLDFVDRIRRMVGSNMQVEAEDDELDLINRMIDIVRTYDPDILTGFEVHNSSWGYLIERARLRYEFNLPDEFSRMKSQSHGRFGKDADRWGFTQTSTVRVTGRHTINIWRAMRSELNLLQYTMENVVFHVLHRRIPHYPFSALTKWYQSKKPRDLAKVLDYLITRTRLDLEILDANELIPRISEQARLLGVDFFSVFSRGSQFKVESLMFRIAKPESFMLVSPSRKQVGAQNALECLPLVMEPQSAFYNSPLLVLDFQSLYPSVMIAYNYCYSTCLGRIVGWRGTNKLGFADFQREPGLLELVQDKLNIAPNGMMYVKPEMRKSLLAKMLGEILETRVMVKSGMKVDKDDRTLQQLLNNRQLALKLIANVTYGYTSASFSGRMPCSEIADSIVQTGRETLEKAIALIHSVERWGAEVVYGDTDSLFVYLKGRSREEAFKIGDEIAKTVTEMNPRPVKLKFEKVYHPCVLLAKKRYVGFKYESPNQTEPEFDAKGIETVRRDGTPAEQKIEEKALKMLFRTSDLSQVKRYFQAQCNKIMTGRFSVQDFCFAKEVKLGMYAEKGPPPPGALIATRRMLRDPRTEPQYGERVPYVVIAGAPGARLWERCVEPERLIYDENAELDAEYYINKNLIPPLERIFNLVGANVRQWYDEMPKVLRIRNVGGPRDIDAMGKGKKTMESYMSSSLCLACRTKLPPLGMGSESIQLPLCGPCRTERTQQTLLTLRQRLRGAERKARDMNDVCHNCANLAPIDEVHCDSRDCPVFYSRVKADTQLRVTRNSVGRVLEALEGEELEREILRW